MEANDFGLVVQEHGDVIRIDYAFREDRRRNRTLGLGVIQRLKVTFHFLCKTTSVFAQLVNIELRRNWHHRPYYNPPPQEWLVLA